MSGRCGCCQGTQHLTPTIPVNPPGLDRLAYRVGRHGSFLATMLARLSSVTLPDQARPLDALTARGGDDPAVALLDAWATVADVLTFYQERIANEGYLATATERRSVLELARLVGHRLRPGVAASVLLAYTIDKDPAGRDPTVLIPESSRAQSVPGPGERPQTFETEADLEARASWNVLRPQLTRPTVIDSAGAAALGTIWLAGIATGVRPNDRLLAVFAADQSGQAETPAVLRVTGVTPEPLLDRTRVELLASVTVEFLALARRLAERLAGHREVVRTSLAGGRRAAQIDTDVLAPLERLADPRVPPERLLAALEQGLARLRSELEAVRRRGFGRLTAWLEETIRDLEPAAATAAAAAQAGPGAPPAPGNLAAAAANADGPVLGLGALLGPLARPPSRPPATPAELDRSAGALFAVGSDVGPQLLVALNPALGPTLYKAWATTPPADPVPLERLDTLRVRAAPFGATAPRKLVLDPRGIPVDTEEWPLDGAGQVRTRVEVRYQNVAGTILPASALVELAVGDAAVQADVPLDGTTKDVALPPGSVHIVETRTAGQSPSVSFQFTGPVTRTVTAVGPPPILINLVAGVGPVAVTLDAAPGQSLRPVSGQQFRGGAGGRRFTVGMGAVPSGEPIGRVSVADDGFAAPQERRLLPLDAVYDGIVPNTLVVVDRPGAGTRIVTLATGVETVARTAYGISAKVTQLTLADPWLTDDDVLLSSVRDTVVHAQAEKVTLAREPRTDDVAGDQIELDALHDGLQTGRRLVVSGERTDLAGATGVRASEPVMLAGVVQQAGAGDTVHTTLQLAEPLAYTYKRDTVEILGNVVGATHGESGQEVLGSGDGGAAMQSFTLRRSPLTYLAAPTPLGVEAALEVRVDEVRWQEADSLVFLGPKDHRYVLGTDDADQTTVRFGNGVNGARLPTGVENVVAAYRVGIGRAGNVGPGRISQLLTRPPQTSGVANPLPASGGADRDTLDQARRNTPLAARALDRLVSVADYEDFSLARAGIGKASARRLSDGARTLVHLTIGGTDATRVEPSSELFRNLRLALRQAGDPAQPVQVAVRELVLLVIAATVRIEPDRRWPLVEEDVRAALLDQFAYDRRQLGQDVLLGEVLGAIQSVPGVDSATVDVLATVPESVTPDGLQAVADAVAAPPPSRIPMRLARPEEDGDPPLAILPAQLAVLSPLVPDTLILEEGEP